MMESSEILFKLIHIALGNESDLTLPTDVNWKEVTDLAFDQGLAAISADGMQMVYDAVPRLETALDSPALENLKYEWFAEAMAEESDYCDYTQKLQSLLDFAEVQNIRLLLLKGYGLSLNYPVPSHRPTGDIDVFPVGDGMWQTLNDTAGKHSKVEVSTRKHSVFNWHGVTVENHNRLLDGFSFKAEERAETILEPRSVEDLVACDGYYTLGHTQNWFYLVCHIAQHFCANGELLLRQLMDLALHLDRHRDAIDVEGCREWMTATGYRRFNDIIVSLSADLTGLDLSKFIFSPASKADKERVLAVVLKRDHMLDFPKGWFSRVWYKLRKLLSNAWKYRYVPMTFGERVKASVRLHLERPELV